VIALLQRWGVLTAPAANLLLARHAPPVLRNLAGREIGASRPAFAV
jgi:hypothetical protein